MALNDIFVPKGVHRVVDRPLNGGIRRDQSPQMLEEGAFWDIRDGYAEPEGIRRRPATARYGDWGVDYPPIQGVWTVRAVSGDSYTILMDQKYIYKISQWSLTRLDWTYAVGTVAVAGTTVTGDGTSWNTEDLQLNVGDILVLDADGSGDGPEECVVEVITSATSVEVETAPTGTYGVGTDYEWRRAVTNAVIASPISVNNRLYIADGSRFISYTDGTDFDTLSGSYLWKPHSLAYFHDRLWAGHIIEGTTNYRPQIRWSDVGIGNLDTWGVSSFVNLPYGFGRVVRLLGMSDFLIAYFTDQLYIGQETSLPLAPVEFRRVETGGIGLVNPYAVSPLFDGHAFVGQDNIYVLSPKGIEPIGDAIVRRTIKQCQAPDKISLVTDYSTSSILAGFPIGSSNVISEIWRFSYRTKQWTREERTTNMLMIDSPLESLTWDTLDMVISTDNWDVGMGVYWPSWNSMIVDEAWNQQVFFNVGAELYYYQQEAGRIDADSGSAVRLLLETGDKDFDLPDTTKVWNKLSLQVEVPLALGETLAFVVEGSLDKGVNWKNLGTLTIPERHDEGSVNFRLNGAAVRFRLTQTETSDIEPFTVSEIVYYFKVLGGQIASRTDV